MIKKHKILLLFLSILFLPTHHQFYAEETTSSSYTDGTSETTVTTDSTEDTSSEPLPVVKIEKTKKYVTISTKTPMWFQTIDLEKQQLLEPIQQTPALSSNDLLLATKKVRFSTGISYYFIESYSKDAIGWISEEFLNFHKNPWIIKKQSNYLTFSNTKKNILLNLTTLKKGGKYSNITLRSKNSYSHINGKTYFDLYQKDGKFLGFIESNQIKTSKNAQGIAQLKKQLITITQKTNSYSDFKGTIRYKNKQLQGRTLLVKRIYFHANGQTYYSLYNNKQQWIGYVNAKNTQKTTHLQGVGQNYQETVRIKNIKTPIYQDFTWKTKKTKPILSNTQYEVRRLYYHYNGNRYLSLYDQKGRWLGYIPEKNTTRVQSVGEYLGFSRKQLVDHLNTNKKFYLGTPYRGLLTSPGSVLSPIGSPSKLGPGMNCTGFVAVSTKNSGAKTKRITDITYGIGGIANAYNWRDALTKHTKYETFNTIEEFVASGKGKRGDILYLEADFSRPNYDCHIGIYWGTPTKRNLFWHQPGAGNRISNIYSGTPYSKIYLFSMD